MSSSNFEVNGDMAQLLIEKGEEYFKTNKGMASICPKRNAPPVQKNESGTLANSSRNKAVNLISKTAVDMFNLDLAEGLGDNGTYQSRPIQKAAKVTEKLLRESLGIR